MIMSVMLWTWEKNNVRIKKIYTDWANHYLEKNKQKRLITDLQHDITDGVLLADVIEAVTNQKVQDIKQKPRTSSQMIENLNTCLTFLAHLGVNVEGLSAKDIKDGNLKAILGLFFSLSRFKQQQKQQQQQQQQQQVVTNTSSTTRQDSGKAAQANGGDMLSRLPSPFKSSSKGSMTKEAHHLNGEIPSNLNRTRGTSKAATNNNTITSGSSLPTSKTSNLRESGTTRSTSPGVTSNIPIPGGRGLTGSRTQTSDKNANRLPTSTSTSSASSGSSLGKGTKGVSLGAQKSAVSGNKNSMLDKFKFFNSKDKSKSGVNKSVSRSTTSSSNKSDSDRSSHRSSTGSGGDGSSSIVSDDPKGVPKPAGKVVKKTIGRSGVGAVRSPSSSKVSEDRRTTPPNSGRVSPATSYKSTASAKSDRTSASARSGQSSPGSSRKSKIASLIPKNSTPGKVGKTSPVSSQTSIPTASTGIPKPGSVVGKSTKGASREDLKGPSSISNSNSSGAAAGGSTKTGLAAPHSRPLLGTSASLRASQRAKALAGGSKSSGSQLPPPGHMQGMQTFQQHQQQTPGKSLLDKTHADHNANTQTTSSSKVQARTVPTSTVQSSAQQNNSTAVPSAVGAGHKNASSAGSGHHHAGQGSTANHSIKTSSSQTNNVSATSSVSKSSGGTQTGSSSLAQPKMVSSGGTQTNLSALQKIHSQKSGIPKQNIEDSVKSKSNIPGRSSGSSSPALKRKDLNNVRSSPSYSMSSGDSSSGLKRSDSSSPSTSKSTTSSNDSVIYKPSSCDDMSGVESDSSPGRSQQSSNSRTTACVSNSESKQNAQNAQLSGVANSDSINSSSNTKVETTFSNDVKTESLGPSTESRQQGGTPPKQPSKETTIGEDLEGGAEDTVDIKPMQPLSRSYLKGLSGSGQKGPQGSGPINGQSVPHYLSTTSSRYGINKSLLDPVKVYANSQRRLGSNYGMSSDYSDYSDVECYADMTAGYMSDGDILKSNRIDDFSGYLSEGGASMYARRMQQRFREGMQAVRECMQKSAGLIDDDDDSFDDSSSISSGDISDTINEISTDENYSSPQHKTKGSKQGALTNGNTPPKSHGGIHGDPAMMAAGLPWRKYSDGSLGVTSGGMPRNEGPWIKQTDLKAGSPGAYGSLPRRPGMGLSRTYDRVDDILQNSAGSGGSPPGQGSPWLGQDGENGPNMFQRNQNGRASSGPVYGFRRPVSSTSVGSIGSNGSRASGRYSNAGMVGGPNYENIGPFTNGPHSPYASPNMLNGSKSVTDMNPDAFSSNSLDRRHRGLASSKTQSGLSTSNDRIDPDAYKSSTLGRRRPGDSTLRERLFGSRSSLTGGNKKDDEASTNKCNSTIISNPHATLSRRSDSGIPGSGKQGLPFMNDFLSPDYAQNHRGSGMYGTDPTSPAAWLRSAQNGMQQMSGTESMESLSSSSSIQAQIQQARALSLANAQILAHARGGGAAGDGGRVERSNSIKSSQSERGYPVNCQTNPDLPRTNSYGNLDNGGGPVSPTPSNSSQSSSRFTYPLTALSSSMYTSTPSSMVHSNSSHSNLPFGGLLAMAQLGNRNDELHGSSLSLQSSSSSIYSTAEEKQNAEIRKLKRELECATEKVSTLTNQLSTNAHVVAAFEQSLSNMTSRLQNLTCTAEAKDTDEILKTIEALRLQRALVRVARINMMSTDWKQAEDTELAELRATIEALKKQSTTLPFQQINLADAPLSPNSARRHASVSSTGSAYGGENATSGNGRISRQMSSESMSSLNSMSSACSATSQQSSTTDTESGKKKKKGKGGWLRSSFSKAFSRKKNKNGSVSDVEPDTASMRSADSVPNSPMVSTHMPHGIHMINGPNTPVTPSLSASGLYDGIDGAASGESVVKLKKQLREKDMKLTDIQLEALSSAHQLDQLRDTMNKMRDEMSSLKADNDRLQRMMNSKSLTSSQSSDLERERRSTGSLDRERKVGLGQHPSLEMLLSQESPDKTEGRKIAITVLLTPTGDIGKVTEASNQPEVVIGAIPVSGKMKWDMLDSIVRRMFREYVLRVDPVTNLGLNAESVLAYHIGEITRTKDSGLPELLPCGYLVGDTTTIQISLRGVYQNSVDAAAFETLIPKSIMQRYVSLLLEHRRIILCGPSGTGKTYLAQKMAEHLVIRSGKELSMGSIATFNVDHKSSKELRQYLANIADQCESSNVGDLPSVIILDNLHNVSSLGEVFNGFLSCKYQKCPYIIGTMNQSTCSTTNLQLHHNFRWVLCANHMEPVKGFLGRYLKRKLIEAEVTGIRNNDLVKIIEWMPKVWAHLNKFLETHSSSDVTIGPRLFLSCPMDVNGSQVWFTDLWNYSIVPYLLEAVREGIQLYGRRAPWEDPAEWVIDSYPWSKKDDGGDGPSLLRLRPEDVGYDSQGLPAGQKAPKSAAQSESEGDPLLNMLMRLQEAASYSSPQSQDSDSTSLDSHSSSLSSGIQDISNATVESTI
ncbi:neuron navigator 2 isoform X3 [Lingula anatina]|uniref:Neuron navigator 2 isoform X3 n=1 Tax=Lingula anatina TaxID=7574 RepID=A0A1S3J6D2_LINAN|nr:neuron navigator 2 isoform X3 [Lingula anatina]|eukprot:XP_013405950.1 neuron navigator 2 isoform X3 [Lingula anatina]